MSTTAPPPPKKVNRIGLEVINYKGSKTTLCAGCGHNSISERIVECFYELGIQPYSIAKFSGIGCSSKSPAYFLGLSHGFNAVHGRMPPFDCCALALRWGATFVARSFSGDKKQLQAILKTAISHHGLSVIDVVSPCVTFNDHEGSTKSYSYMKDHEFMLHELDYVPSYEDISVEIPEGEVRDVLMHDGSHLRIRKLDRDYDPTDRFAAVKMLEEAEAKHEVLTGVLYVNTHKPTFLELLNLVDSPVATLPESQVRPSKSVLDEVMEELR
jgi:pyruvate/2-oxoacid:ferredoxin oxidoreductase beta subunit